MAILFGLLAPLGHAQEAPKTFKTLTTSKNRTYEDVQVREVTPGGIKILHASGTATIPFEQLPADIQKQFGGFDAAAAAEHREREARALKEQEAAIDAELRSAGNPKPIPAGSPKKMPPAAGARSGKAPRPEQREPEAAAPGNAEPGNAKSVEKGILSCRIVGYRNNIKRVEFKVRTNCAATLQVHQVAPDEHSATAHTDTFEIQPNVPFVREIWVFNDYSADLHDSKGKPLDTESTDKKTRLGGLSRPTLR